MLLLFLLLVTGSLHVHYIIFFFVLEVDIIDICDHGSSILLDLIFLITMALKGLSLR